MHGKKPSCQVLPYNNVYLNFYLGNAHLGASPDGIVTCSCCPTRVLEIKCAPAAHKKGKSPKEPGAMDYLNYGHGKETLKTTHKHYAQIQTQMGVTGYSLCDFVVWNPHGIVICRIEFDEDFWSEVKMASESFYIQFLLPLIVSTQESSLPSTSSQSLPPIPSTSSQNLPPVPSTSSQNLPPVPSTSSQNLPPVPSTSSQNLPPVPSTSQNFPTLGIKAPSLLEQQKQKSRPKKYLCTVCHRIVASQAVACDACNRWTHFRCVGLKGNEEFLENNDWYCGDCAG